MSRLLWLLGGAAIGGLVVLQLKPNPESARARVAAGVRVELVEAGGPLGGLFGSIYDASNVGSVANELLDLAGVPYDA